jgi:hypothetical protein
MKIKIKSDYKTMMKMVHRDHIPLKEAVCLSASTAVECETSSKVPSQEDPPSSFYWDLKPDCFNITQL